MNHPPAIDYPLLGAAMQAYIDLGYQPVEVPWAVDEKYIEATLPLPIRSILTEVRYGDTVYQKTLVGSAEQGFLSMGLEPDRYVACTPCFRSEPEYNDHYQRWFMKIELFDNGPGADGYEMMEDAYRVMQRFSGCTPSVLATDEGHDLMINGIEVGSYGNRSVPGIETWAYGTGLALPRFSVAAGRPAFSKT